MLLALFVTLHVHSQEERTVVLDKMDPYAGNYIYVAPKSKEIKGVLILIAGFGQYSTNTFSETKLEEETFKNGILTISFAAGNKLYADSVTELRLNNVIKDIVNRFQVSPESFVLGGYSAGGMIALRYVERCNEFPDNYPIKPAGVFMVDSPIDIFSIWDQLKESYNNHYSEPAYLEAEYALKFIEDDFGIPSENIETYSELSAFSMNKAYGTNEVFLYETPVRAYHDVDIPWRLINRNQTVHLSNYEVTAELINRLLLAGNEQAEFMQSFQTGYRSNGVRHPHSWSIVDEKELMIWMLRIISK